nr:universal stress protein [uncultured Cupriavidus sp.]
MRNVLLATDGSRFSDAAARVIARRQLLRDDFTVHVAHCMPDLSGEVKAFISHTDIEAWHQDSSGRAMQSVLDILAAAQVPTVPHTLVGFAPEKVLALATTIQAECILLGTHGRGGFLDNVLGSVATRVLAHAPCPVLLVRD